MILIFLNIPFVVSQMGQQHDTQEYILFKSA